MNRFIIILVLLVNSCFADYVIPEPQPLARGLTEKQLEVVVSKVPASAQVTLPAHLLAKKKQDINEKLIIDSIKAVIEDSRKNIPEASSLTDIEIALLYLGQMTKQADTISTNSTMSIERLIGDGIRADLKTRSIKQ